MVYPYLQEMDLKFKPPTKERVKKILKVFSISFFVILTFFLSSFLYKEKVNSKEIGNVLSTVKENLQKVEAELNDLKNQDQIKKNQELSTEIENINKTFKKAVLVYEDINDLKQNNTVKTLEKDFALVLFLLSERKYQEAEEKLNTLEQDLKKESEKIYTKEVTQGQSQSLPQSNNPPPAGYARQSVATDVGTFTVSIVSSDYSSTKVIVDTASASDCSDNCPVLSLSDYILRNGAFAGVNGSYFCPASYPTCAGKTNSFDTLLMNKNKTYFNSNNNVYSTNPGVIFGGGYIRFVSAVSSWGRDTSIDSMISNYPLLVSGGNITFGGDSDPKKGSKGNRSFVAQKGNTVYIGVVHSATVAESAYALKALGMENALNLDNGGSTALWYQGYKLGPGRSIPNAILFVKR